MEKVYQDVYKRQDYTYNLSGDGYLDTGCNVTANHYNATMHVVKGLSLIHI